MMQFWWAQIKAVIRLEMKKTFFARRGLWIYILALLPVLLFIAQAVRGVQAHNLSDDAIAFAGVFQFFYLRLAIFFGCLGIFMNLFRGEILDKSLHFYFLAPIRREVLMVGKFLAGLLATCVIFVTSEFLQIVIFTGQYSSNARNLYLYQNHGLAHAAAYLGITALACLG